MNREEDLEITFHDDPQDRPAGVDYADSSPPAGTPEDTPAEAGPPPAAGNAPRGTEVMPIREDEPGETPSPVFDWLTEVAIPLGIFGLLGSLLYYLIDLWAARGGEFSSALRWVCFWFLLAAILITRIRTKYGNAAVALPYVLGLGLVTAIVVTDFTVRAGALAAGLSPSGMLLSLAFNLSLVGLIWWSAHRVTRECTIEENLAESLSHGFLDDLSGERPRGRARADGSRATARHPGRMILWVSVAAVITFGLGARVVGDQGPYAGHAFVLMISYVFFALFLLAMTNLSAIRMDVRRRQVRMMKGLTAAWIGMSLALVLLIAGISALVPRPLSPGTMPEARERPAWLLEPRQAALERGPASGMGDPPGQATEPGHRADTTATGVPADHGEAGQEAAGMQEGTGADQAAGDGGPGAQAPVGGQDAGEAAGAAAAQQAAGGGASSDQQAEAGAGGEGTAGAQGRTASSLDGLAGRINWWLLLLLLLLIALIIYLLIRYRKFILPLLHAIWGPLRAAWLALCAFLQRLWRSLGLGLKKKDDPFADLPADPFADIWEQRELGANMTPSQIVRHVYRAFMAYCALRGYPRRDQQTEYEFLRTVPSRIGLPVEDQRKLTSIYVAATYSPNEVTPGMVASARDIWGRLRPAIDTALAAEAANTGRKPARATA